MSLTRENNTFLILFLVKFTVRKISGMITTIVQIKSTRTTRQ
ncbi:hypothetical protein WVIC16_50015 [Weissella viridescens]|nr:hypothetical protein WVIC16_50015 [Weissella viridescens]